MTILHYGFSGDGPMTKPYIDDLFATNLYTGTGSSQSITNGINLSNRGGLVWVKQRTTGYSYSHTLHDSARGVGYSLKTDATDAQVGQGSTDISAFNTNGFSVGGTNNSSGANTIAYAAWTFRRAPKFFDVVTYTGDGTTNKAVPHSLGVAPGLIIVKNTGIAEDWQVYHRSLGYLKRLRLNLTNGVDDLPGIYGYTWGDTSEPTNTNFYVGDNAGSPTSNYTAYNYVAYLFAHDTSSDGLVQCGTFTTAVTTGNFSVTLGWEPQFIMVKSTVTGANWIMVDCNRDMKITGSNAALYPNLANAETASAVNIFPNATGFSGNILANEPYVYLAIRRSNKPLTSGMNFYNAVQRTGTSSAVNVTGFSFAPDWVICKAKGTTSGAIVHANRMLGNPYLTSSTSNTETTNTAVFPSTIFGYGDGFEVGTDTYTNSSAYTYINWAFKRTKGVFDIVCYTGTGSVSTITHNLGVTPEFMIIKGRNNNGTAGTLYWGVYTKESAASSVLLFQSTTGLAAAASYFNSTAPTSSVFTVGTNVVTNGTGNDYVALLFASSPGLVKFGSYTGNGGAINVDGTSQTIDCGFTAGVRFVMIKWLSGGTSMTGSSWFIFDTVRGIVAATDSILYANTGAVEVTTYDTIDPDNSGFIINQLAATNLNVTSALYWYMAIA